MLIIFDLDDTLVDTSGSIIPFRLSTCLTELIHLGLKIDNIEEALECLKQLDFGAKSSEEALKEFLELYEAPASFFAMGKQIIYGDRALDEPIKATPFAYETLWELSRKHTLCIVSIGQKTIQMDKLKKAGIDTAFFSRIVVCENLDKKPIYEAIMAELNALPHEVVVCGDRVSRDLIPAKQLGCKTIHFRWGRGLNHDGLKDGIDHVITSLLEIKHILTQQEQKFIL